MATKYLIYKNLPGPDGVVEATSATAAIRAHVRVDMENGDSADGQFVAIPARSVKPVSVKVERTVKLG